MTDSEQSVTYNVGPIDMDRVIEVYAKSLAIYYAAEKALMADPTPETLHGYHLAQDRYWALSRELRNLNGFGEALVGTEHNDSVGR